MSDNNKARYKKGAQKRAYNPKTVALDQRLKVSEASSLTGVLISSHCKDGTKCVKELQSLLYSELTCFKAQQTEEKPESDECNLEDEFLKELATETAPSIKSYAYPRLTAPGMGFVYWDDSNIDPDRDVVLPFLEKCCDGFGSTKIARLTPVHATCKATADDLFETVKKVMTEERLNSLVGNSLELRVKIRNKDNLDKDNIKLKISEWLREQLSPRKIALFDYKGDNCLFVDVITSLATVGLSTNTYRAEELRWQRAKRCNVPARIIIENKTDETPKPK